MNSAGSRQEGDSGFTLIEVMIASLVLAVGLLSAAYGVGVGLGVVMTSNEDTIARQKAREAVEDVFTARDTASITFDQVCNVGQGTNCIFVNGFTPLTTPGPDEIVNTADDGPVETADTPGPDGILGTADDVFVPLSNYTRQIQVTTVSTDPPLKQITVTIQYITASGWTRSTTITVLISPYV